MSREDLLPSINELLEKPEIRNRHSFFQLRYFVIGKEPTIQARLRKCLTELATRRETIESLQLSIEEAEDDIELANIDIKQREEHVSAFGADTNDLEKEANKIYSRKANRKKQGLEKTIKRLKKTLEETEEEAGFFLLAYKDLEKVESLKPYDDPKTNTEYWNERYTEELKLRLLLRKPIELELAKCILAMDKETLIREEFVNILTQIEEKEKIESAREDTESTTKKLKSYLPSEKK